MSTHKRQLPVMRSAVLITIAFTLLLSLNIRPSITSAITQTTRATISGRITDEKDSAVPKARVIARNLDTDIKRETTTDEEGRFRISELPVGKYEVEVERQGFRPVAQRGIDLTVGREAVIDFTLNVGDVKEKVTVEGDVSQVERTTSALGYLVNRRQIELLPLNGRDVLQLATLQSGVTSASSLTIGQSDVGAGATRLSINGGRIDFNAFYLDGTETADAFGYSPGGLGGGFLGVDALREFQVLTSSYSAEYGHGGGAIINAVTKSGTNDIHGSAFEFHRNSALDARNFFDRNLKQLPFRRNQFGGSVGGPVIKDRVFFLLNYEGLRRREGVPSFFNVPSPDARAGFLVDPINNPGANPNDRSRKRQITIAPAIAPYLALYPVPNGAIQGDTGVFVRNFNEATREEFGTARIDYKLANAHSLASRYTIDDSDLIKVGGVIQNLVLNNRNQYISLEEQAIVSARSINNLRFSFNRSNFASDFPFSVTVNPNLGFLPGRRMGGFTTPGFTPLREAQTDSRFFTLNTYEVNDQFVHTSGAHSFKFGGSLRRYQLNADSALATDGIFTFGGGVEPFLTGRAQALFTTLPNTDYYRGIRQTLFSVYAQDDWKLRRNFTLNLGLRYEPISTPTEANGKLANLRNLTDASPTVGEPYIDNPSKKNFGPRVGFAWDPTGGGKTAIRGGGGIFYSVILPMRYRFMISNVAPFARLSLIPGPFPNAFAANPNPINSGFVWITQFDAEQPAVYQWNLNVQREIGRDLMITAGYVGSRGVHLETGDNTNVRVDSQLVNGRKFFPAVSSPRINPNFRAIQALGFSGDSYYHGLQLGVTRRYAAGLQLQGSYTYSKSIDTNSSTESVFSNGVLSGDRQDPFNPRLDRARSDFDVRHNFVANFLWDLPFGNGRLIGKNLSGPANKLVGGWSAGGIVNLRSGFPFGLAIGFDRARNGIDSGGFQSQRPDLAPNIKLSDAVTGNADKYIDPSFFRLQPAGFYGASPRNGMTGPNLKTFDFTIFKRTPITERLSTEFRIEAFNLFNRVNLTPPDFANRVIFAGIDASGAGIVPSSFGQLTRTSTSSRQLQFGLKLLW
ncbi:MAG TPA: TonB-dependent receptor [Blastocatellia bacterium]|nr:TonB-dependent receptor [Blastocatellia bacterium]